LKIEEDGNDYLRLNMLLRRRLGGEFCKWNNGNCEWTNIKQKICNK